jgi:hypothetical protein
VCDLETSKNEEAKTRKWVVKASETTTEAMITACDVSTLPNLKLEVI